MSKESNLVAHARYELELIGNGPMIDDHVLEIVKIFSEQGHSGSSAVYTIKVIAKLLNFENLAPLTNNPDEWVLVFDNGWQNKRNSAAFSSDGGKTYTLTTELAGIRKLHTSADHEALMAERALGEDKG